VGLTWDDPAEIAWALIDAYPDGDPLDLNFVDLHRMVAGLAGFVCASEDASEPKLEAIVMAWYEQR
jgi:FeS assembly protein IscX